MIRDVRLAYVEEQADLFAARGNKHQRLIDLAPVPSAQPIDDGDGANLNEAHLYSFLCLRHCY